MTKRFERLGMSSIQTTISPLNIYDKGLALKAMSALMQKCHGRRDYRLE